MDTEIAQSEAGNGIAVAGHERIDTEDRRAIRYDVRNKGVFVAVVVSTCWNFMPWAIIVFQDVRNVYWLF